jgi:transposase
MVWDNLADRRAAIKPDTLVVGVDIGKFIHVARARFADGSFTCPLSVTADVGGFRNLERHIVQWRRQAKCTAVIVGLESTGVYWENLAFWLEGRGYRVVQVNPLHVHRSKEMLDNCPGKTDDKDALLIADLVAQGKYLSFVMPRGDFAELRQLAALRARLVVERTTYLSRLHLEVSQVFPEFSGVFRDIATRVARRVLYYFPTPADIRRHTVAQMARQVRRDGGVRLREDKLVLLKERAAATVGISEGKSALVLALRDTLAALDALDKRIGQLETRMSEVVVRIDESQYLLSISAVGPVSAAVILGETGGIRRYVNAEAILKLAGLNLFEVSSGMHKGARHISRRGRPLLRQILYFIALHHAQPGMALYPYYARMVDRGTPKPKALVALSCRIVRIMYALVRDGRCFSVQAPKPTLQAA